MLRLLQPGRPLARILILTAALFAARGGRPAAPVAGTRRFPNPRARRAWRPAPAGPTPPTPCAGPFRCPRTGRLAAAEESTFTSSSCPGSAEAAVRRSSRWKAAPASPRPRAPTSGSPSSRRIERSGTSFSSTSAGRGHPILFAASAPGAKPPTFWRPCIPPSMSAGAARISRREQTSRVTRPSLQRTTSKTCAGRSDTDASTSWVFPTAHGSPSCTCGDTRDR